MEITILLESTDPLTGRIVAAIADHRDESPIDMTFQGWIGLLRALEDLVDYCRSLPLDVG